MQHTLPFVKGPYKSIRPLVVGHEQLPPGPRYGPFRRKHFIFQYVVSGTGLFECPYGNFTMSTGDIFVMHKGDLVKYTADKYDPWEYIWVEFDCEDDLPDIFNNGKITCPEAEEAFFDLLKIPTMKTIGQLPFANSIIYKIISIIDNNQHQFSSTNTYIREAINIITKNYIQKLSVEDIAKELNIDRSYLYTLFLKEKGVSPKEYIDNHRFNAAMGIIKSSNLSISEIATSTGYNDISAFSRAFKKRTGMTPTRFRKEYGMHK